MDFISIIYRYINHSINNDTLIETLMTIDKNKFSNEEKENIEKLLEEIKTILKKDRDSNYERLCDLFVNNLVYKKYWQKMNDLELLELIAQYIKAFVPPNIEQNKFDDLVTVGIQHDKREALWRLAFNYNGTGKNFTQIEDYFIHCRDAYYFIELLCAVEEDLNIKQSINKIINTKDKKFILNCINGAQNIGIFTEEELEKLKDE